jgi:acyl carrier protein
MEQNEHYHTLRKLIEPYLPEEVSPEALKPESHLVNELNINSSHLVDLVLDVEDHYDIRLEDEEMQQMQTVGDALAIIEKKVSS